MPRLFICFDYLKLSDAPRARRETIGVVETNRTILEWSENITKAIEDEKARGESSKHAVHSVVAAHPALQILDPAHKPRRRAGRGGGDMGGVQACRTAVPHRPQLAAQTTVL